MKAFFATIGTIVSLLFVIVIIVGLGWMAAGNDLAMQWFFAPKHEAVRRETFEQSKAYQEGMAQEVRSMQMDYISASPEHKDALASVILHRTADCEDQLPSDLRSFVDSLKKDRF